MKINRTIDERIPLLTISDLAVSFSNGAGPRIQAVSLEMVSDLVKLLRRRAERFDLFR